MQMEGRPGTGIAPDVGLQPLRVGIMGGTFNPIHISHLEMAEEAYRRLALSTVLFIPVGDPPHKTEEEAPGVAKEHRRNMVALAIADTPYFSLNEMELEREGYTYAVDTLVELGEMYPPGTMFFYILGADAFLYLRHWKTPQRVFPLCTFVVFRRFDEDMAQVQKEADYFTKTYGANIILMDFEPTPVSSTFLRESLINKQTLCGLLPPKVEEYIRRWHLYGS
ncbi:nicotinate-nucleotide adenylyltransferase [Eubacteriales bacterium OttesenSCG-928-M02]|nr:nicotinate-nucleotide adenylyltransferase [Eubacteriales bacterium OttesenSCG-928-M02]